VGGTDYKYWRQMLNDVTDEQLLDGFRASKDFQGYLTWAEFRKLCTESNKRAPCHKQFVALPIKAMEAEELRARLKTMREELSL